MRSLLPLAASVSLLFACSDPPADEGTSTEDVVGARPRAPQRLFEGMTAHFDSFDVTVRGTVDANTKESGHGASVVGIDVKVCSKGTTNHVTWDPWSLVGSDGTEERPDANAFPFDATKRYPTMRDLRAGECAEGIIAIPFDGERGFEAVKYKNSLGDVATWELSFRKGETATFPHFAVTFRGSEVRSQPGESTPVIGLSVEVCAVGKADFATRAPWSLVTAVGDIGYDDLGPVPWKESELYPMKASLQPGQCAKGVVPIWQNDSEAVLAIRYKNTYGEEAVWLP